MAFYDVTNNGTLKTGSRSERKFLVTVAAWDTTYTEGSETKTAVDGLSEIIGYRTEDSSIEFNADIATSTDICGNTFTDVNKTEPQQDFDPFNILGGSKLAEKLVNAALENDIDAYNNTFSIYIIAGFISADSGTTYKCIKHSNCSIIPTSLGGDSYNSMPIEVHYSNTITVGTASSIKSAKFDFVSGSNTTKVGLKNGADDIDG